MDSDVVSSVLEYIDKGNLENIDLTGGAPELNKHFRSIVLAARNQGIEVIDRCNLTVLFEPGQESTAEFLAKEKVVVVASLPCYLEENVQKQRGKQVFDKSIKALQLLNSLGYGSEEGLQLHLVFNPVGAELPPAQDELELAYKDELGSQYGITFNSLYTLTNMPINRFKSVLQAHDQLTSYMHLLKSSFESSHLNSVMCKDTVSVDWQGYLYDCDFNQMLNMPMLANGRPAHLNDLISNPATFSRSISVDDHCFGCTAGQGSSCGGALT